MDDDYQTWRENGNEKFSFMSHSFILTPSTKTLGLYYDNRIRMYENRRFCLIQTLIGQPTHPYLKLKVRREHVVQDALVEVNSITNTLILHLKFLHFIFIFFSARNGSPTKSVRSQKTIGG